MNFDKAIEFVLSYEGGYVNDPRDPGGETKYGISKRYHPNVDIKNLTLEQAKAIYKKEYWDKCKCDFVPESLKLLVLDTAVNQGSDDAIKCLQAIAKVKQDGVLGSVTLKALALLESKSALVDFTTHRILAYVKNNPPENFSTYGKGWTARAVKAAIASIG